MDGQGEEDHGIQYGHGDTLDHELDAPWPEKAWPRAAPRPVQLGSLASEQAALLRSEVELAEQSAELAEQSAAGWRGASQRSRSEPVQPREERMAEWDEAER